MAVNLLCSYAFHADTDLASVRKDLVCGLLLIDSGAFTAHTKGTPVSLDAYAKYLEKWQGCWDHAVTLDVIGNPAATRVNTRRLHERGLPVMPVFTKGGTLADFDAMVREVGYVCVGGLVGAPTKVQRARVGMLQRRAADQGGGIHALGVGSLDTLRGARPYSADASNISSAFMYGTIAYFNGQRICMTAISDHAKLKRDWKHIRAHGIDLGSLVRTGRMPSVENNGRGLLMRAMSLAYAAADEHLKYTHPVAPPHSVAGSSGTNLYNSVVGRNMDIYEVATVDRALHGTHLFNSVVTDGYAAHVAAVDRALHGTHLYNSVVGQWRKNGDVQDVAAVDHALHPGDETDAAEVPLIWRTYGAHHVCHRRAQEDMNADQLPA